MKLELIAGIGMILGTLIWMLGWYLQYKGEEKARSERE